MANTWNILFTLTIYWQQAMLSPHMSINVLKRNMMFFSSSRSKWNRNKQGCKGWQLLYQKQRHWEQVLVPLQLFIRFSQLFIASLISGLYYKLNWAKRASAVYWVLGTLLYPCPWEGLPLPTQFTNPYNKSQLSRAINLYLPDKLTTKNERVLFQPFHSKRYCWGLRCRPFATSAYL